MNRIFPRAYVNLSGESMKMTAQEVDPAFPRRSKLIDYVLGAGPRAGQGSHPTVWIRSPRWNAASSTVGAFGRPVQVSPPVSRTLLAFLLCTLALSQPAPVAARAAAGPGGASVGAAIASHPLQRVGGGNAVARLAQRRRRGAELLGELVRTVPPGTAAAGALETELSRLGGHVVAVSIDADVRNAVDFASRHAPR